MRMTDLTEAQAQAIHQRLRQEERMGDRGFESDDKLLGFAKAAHRAVHAILLEKRYLS